MDPSFKTSLLSIIALVIILGASYLTSRFIAVRFQRRSRGNYIEVVDQLIIGKDKTVLLLKVGEHVYIVGVTSNGMENIAEIPSSDLVLNNREMEQVGFGSYISEYMSKVGSLDFTKKDNDTRGT